MPEAAGTLDAPIITNYSKEIKEGENLVIEGKTYSNSDVIIWLQKDNLNAESFVIKSDNNGEFIFENQQLSKGIYNAWAEERDEFGVKSAASLTIDFLVGPASVIKIVDNNYLPILLIIIILILLIINSIYFIRVRDLKRNSAKNYKKADKIYLKLFKNIKHSITSLNKLQKQGLLSQKQQRLLGLLLNINILDLNNSEKKVNTSKIKNITTAPEIGKIKASNSDKVLAVRKTATKKTTIKQEKTKK